MHQKDIFVNEEYITTLKSILKGQGYYLIILFNLFKINFKGSRILKGYIYQGGI